jgi:hypothetical protein
MYRLRIHTAWARGALLLIAAAAACAEGQGRESRFVERDSAGVTIVENDHRTPMWANDDDAWRLSETPPIQIGNVPGDLTQTLFHAYDSRRRADGSFVVAVSGIGEVRLYDANGAYVETWNRVGDGPGEFTAPWGIYPLAGDSLLIVDADRDAAVFDAQGFISRTLRIQPPDGDAIDAGDPIGQFADGTLVYRAPLPVDSTAPGVKRTRVRLVQYDPAGRALGAIGEFDFQTVRVGEPGGFVFGPSGRFAVADSTIWYGPGDRFEFREIARDGRVIRFLRLDKPLQEVTGPDMFGYKQAVLNMVPDGPAEDSARAELELAQFAEFFPAHGELLVDEAGNLWVQSWRWYDVGAAMDWYVFDPAGRYLGDVSMHSRLEPHQIGADFLLGRISTDNGIEAIYLYGLIKPDSAQS